MASEFKKLVDAIADALNYSDVSYADINEFSRKHVKAAVKAGLVIENDSDYGKRYDLTAAGRELAQSK